MSNVMLHRRLSVPTPHRMFVERVDYIVGYYDGESFRIVSSHDNLSAALECRDAAICLDIYKGQIVILENRTQLIFVI